MIPLHAYHQGMGCFYSVAHDRSPFEHFEVGDKEGEIFIIIDLRNSRFKAVRLEHSVSIVGQQISERGPSNGMFVGNNHRTRVMLNLCFYVAQHLSSTTSVNYALLRATAMPPDNQSYCYAKENHMQSIELAKLSWAMCVCYE